MDFATAITNPTTRHSEDRIIYVGRIDGRLHVAVITYRESVIRVISLRKANKREQRKYVEATNA